MSVTFIWHDAHIKIYTIKYLNNLHAFAILLNGL